MKKIILFVSFSFYFASSYGGTLKQKNADSKKKFGLEGGLNYSKVIYYQRNNYYKNVNSTTFFLLAWHVGGYANIRLSDKIDFLPELIYSIKGFRNNVGNIITTVDGSHYFKMRYNYIEIPLQLKYNFNEHFALMGGPYIGILTRYSSNYLFNYLSHNPKDIPLNIIDIGVVFGVGYQIANGFNFAIKYSQGLRNIEPNYLHPNSNSTIPVHVYNMTFSLCLGWTIGKLHK